MVIEICYATNLVSSLTDQFQELEEAIYRFPLGDNGDDDLDLMIQYPDESNGMAGHNHVDESRMARAIHLPLWSDMMSQGMGGADHAHVGGVSVSNNHVSPNHPLLMGRQATSGVADGPGGSRSTSRGIARQLERGFRGKFGAFLIHTIDMLFLLLDPIQKFCLTENCQN